MDAPAAAHPTDETLAAFGLGESDDLTAEAVARHLDECPACRARVAALPADDFLSRLRVAGGAGVESSHDGSTAATGLRPPDPFADEIPPELLACPQYENVRRLGGGGMGVVYLAINRLMHRPEVLKVLGRHLLDRPGAADRFLREIRSAARLNHPHVVGAYAAVQLGDLLAFAMEYVPGDDLAKVVAAAGPLPVATACRYAAQAALGLQHAHDQGMVHRDIKPSNLILSSGSTVKVLDFGLAKPAAGEADTSLTGLDRMLGTPDYVAPEQITDAQSADTRADVYSLGATLFYLLIGRPPFRAGSVYELLRKHKEEAPPSARTDRPDVPPGLDAVIRKMLAKDPVARYQTPAAVARALAPYTKSARPTAAGSTVRPGVTTPNGALLPEPRRSRRWVLVAAGIGLLAAALLGMSAGGVFRLKTADGTVVLENLPPDAEVVVDGEAVTVSRSGEHATVRLAKGGRHRFKVVLGGREVYTDDLTVTVGGEPVRVRLEPPPAPPIPPAYAPGPAEAPMPRPVVPPDPQPADLFVAGSEWRGVKMIDRGLFGGLTTYYQLAVQKRDGEAFSGIVMDNGPNRNPAHVTGTVRGTEIVWKEVPFNTPKEPIHFTTVRAIRDGAVIAGTTTGSFGGNSNAGRATHYRVPRPDDPPSTDFLPIFDGRSLAGWETSQAQPGGWRVNQFGKLVGTGAVTHLYTRAADYEDFHLRVRAAIISSGPAGVVVRSGFGPAEETPYPNGHRAQIDVGAGANTTGTLVVRAGGREVATVPANRPGPAGGEWFDLEVVAAGPVVRVLVNGRETSRTERPVQPKWGRIALQVAAPQTVVEFAAVVVKRLPPHQK
jgi:serine/threonine protein kinase